jgi:hypothetical protein
MKSLSTLIRLQKLARQLVDFSEKSTIILLKKLLKLRLNFKMSLKEFRDNLLVILLGQNGNNSSKRHLI